MEWCSLFVCQGVIEGGGGFEGGDLKGRGIKAYMKRERGRQHGRPREGGGSGVSIPLSTKLVCIPSASSIPEEGAHRVDRVYHNPFCLGVSFWAVEFGCVRRGARLGI